MTHRCDHCETAIVDESTMVKRDGKTYCCNNCAMAMMESKSAPTQAPISRKRWIEMRCAHCDTMITDRSSVVERDGRTFCCNNCATAFLRAQEAPDEIESRRA